MKTEKNKYGQEGFAMRLTPAGNFMIQTAPREILAIAAYTMAEMIVANIKGKEVDGVEPMPRNLLDDIRSGEIEAGEIVEQTIKQIAIGLKMMRMVRAEARELRENNKKKAEPKAEPEEPEPEITDVSAAAELLRGISSSK